MRLIDADALLEKFTPKEKYKCFLTDINGLYELIEKAPTVELTENCINRQEAISAIQDKYYAHAVGIDIVDIIAHLPSMIEIRPARWIEANPKNSKGCRLIRCSECFKTYIVGFNVDYEMFVDSHKYCIECGSKMHSDKEGSDNNGL